MATLTRWQRTECMQQSVQPSHHPLTGGTANGASGAQCCSSKQLHQHGHVAKDGEAHSAFQSSAYSSHRARHAWLSRRSISVDMFQKAMDLDLRWHLMRKTGEVTRVMDRGTSAIQQVLSTGECFRAMTANCQARCSASSAKCPEWCTVGMHACVPWNVVPKKLHGTSAESVPAPKLGCMDSMLRHRRTERLALPAVLFSIVPQLFDVVAACIFISAELQVWIAVIVLITLGSYVPLTVILTEMRVKYRRCSSTHQQLHPPRA